MKRLTIRAGLALLGMAITLAWWTYHPGDSHTQSSSHIPAKVWNGGSALEVEVDSTTAATMRISFSQHDKPAGEQQTLETYEKILAGPHSWTVDVPAHVGGYIELQADAPNSGDKLTLKIKSNGHVVNEQSEQLNGPLQSGTAFFVQAFYDDYSSAKAESEETQQ